MLYQVSERDTLALRGLTDAEYDLARKLSPRSLEHCPTCGGRDEVIPGSGGVKHWVSPGYDYRGEHHDCFCQAQIALYTRYLLANIGSQYMELNWEDFAGDPDADRWVGDYIEHWEGFVKHGFGLTFASPVQGVGKTWAATHIGKELIKLRQRVYCLDFVQMVDAFCGEHDEKRLVAQRMRENTVLILDDVRAGISERQSNLYALTFEVVIRHRTNFNLPTIFTTNMTESEFESEFPRIHSLIAPKQMWIDMKGVDYRKLSDAATETAEMIIRGEVRPIT